MLHSNVVPPIFDQAHFSIIGNPLVFCHDINECTRQSDECHEDAYCINNESSYDLGFHLDFFIDK